MLRSMSKPMVGMAAHKGAAGGEGGAGNVMLHAFNIAVDGFLIDIEEAQKLGEEFVPVDDCLCDPLSFTGKDRSPVFLMFNKALGIQPLEHVGDAGLGYLEALGNVDRPGVSLFLDQVQDLLEVIVHGDTATGAGSTATGRGSANTRSRLTSRRS